MEPTWLKIKPREPLVLGCIRAGAHFLDTQSYIPGRVLRGAWADWLIAQGREETVLAHLAGVRIGNCFPCTEWQPLRYASPLPLSALSCRRQPGFRSEPYKPYRGHGVVDTLIPNLAYELLRDAGASFPAPFAITCQECQARMEHSSGFYGVYADGKARREYYVRVRERHHAQTKVALSRHRRAAVEGMLYTVTALSPRVENPERGRMLADLSFLGRAYVPREKVAELIAALNVVPIGALRGRGYGRVEAEETAVDGFGVLADRLDQFNEALTMLWSDLRRLAVNAQALPARTEGVYFSVDLLAPGVFRERGLPSLVPRLGINGRQMEIREVAEELASLCLCV